MPIDVRGQTPLIEVFDMSASVAFYRDVLGFEIIAGHGDTTLFFDCPDVDGAYRHLRAKGLEVERPVVRDYGMKQLNVTDPDGFRLCFQSQAE